MARLSAILSFAALFATSVFAQGSCCNTTRTGGKRGLAWPSDNNFDPAVFKSPQVTWLYNWGRTPPTKLKSTFPFYVMQWDEQDVAGLAAAVTKANPAWVLWFNEPDHKQQANVTPEETARLWKLYAQPLRAKGYKVASPAFTNSGAADEGIKWMERFVAACTNCTWDVTATHWYGGWTGDLKEHIDAAKKFGKPIWLTEFALSWETQVANYLEFLPLALSYLDNEPAVQAYAFFGAFHSGGAWDLLDANGQLTQIGRLYVA